MDRCVYWCLRGLGYLLFLMCAMAWLSAAGSILYVVLRLVGHVFSELLVSAIAIGVCLFMGYLLFRIGRFFVNKSVKFQGS